MSRQRQLCQAERHLQEATLIKALLVAEDGSGEQLDGAALGATGPFQEFAFSVQSLIGMLRSLEGENGSELNYGSHVEKLSKLSKLPANHRDNFVEYCLTCGILQDRVDHTYTLQDLSKWLQIKARAKSISHGTSVLYQTDRREVQSQWNSRRKEKPTTMYLTGGRDTAPLGAAAVKPPNLKARRTPLPPCISLASTVRSSQAPLL